MSFNKWIISAYGFLVCVNSSFALEYRKPDEVINLVLVSTFPVEIIVDVSTSGQTRVWYDYQIMQVRDGKHVTWPGFEGQRFIMLPKQLGDKIGYTAKKYQVFEGTRTVYETTVLDDIPVAMEFSDDSVISRLRSHMPCGIPSVGCTNLAFEDMKDIGFKEDKFVRVIPGYGFGWARAIGIDDREFLYVAAEGGSAADKTPVRLLVKLNKEGNIVDKFVYEKSKYMERRFARNPWVWGERNDLDGGFSTIDAKGNLYNVDWELNTPGKVKKVTIKRWRTK